MGNIWLIIPILGIIVYLGYFYSYSYVSFVCAIIAGKNNCVFDVAFSVVHTPVVLTFLFAGTIILIQ